MSYTVNRDAPIHERSLRKKDIKLKKDFRENWGRFLDNHYDPNLHNRPFNAAMNAPKDTYKYSSAGLSHKFIQSAVLQSIDVEEKKDRTQAVVRFKEAQQMEEGDITVFIEYCANSEKTQISTSHSEKKYQSFAKRFRQGIMEKFPKIKVYIKSTHNPNKLVQYKLSKDPNAPDANIIDNQREVMRIGAFEVTLCRREDGFTRFVPIFSKLKCASFPRLSFVLSKICEYAPKCNLKLQICDNIKDQDSELHPEKAEGMHVELKVSFKDTQAGQELDKDLHQIEQEKTLRTPQRPQTAARRQNFNGTTNSYLSKRLQSASKGNSRQFHITSRPFSAKTDFQPNVSKNPYGRRDYSNRMMSSQQMNKTPSLKTLPQRPQTAVGSHNNLRSSMSIGSMRTITPGYGGHSKQGKRKPRPPVKDLIFEGQIDESGCVTFENIPRTTCHLTASENDFFKTAYKFINLPLEQEKEDGVCIYLPIERQDAYTTTIYMIKSNQPSQEEEKASEAYTDEGGKAYFENLSLRAVLLHLYEEDKSEGEGESDLESEVEYEEEFEQTEDKHGKQFWEKWLL